MEVRNLSFSYGDKEVLKNLSFKIKRGKITTVMGSNGCGKSTLFNLMTKNLKVKTGEILLEGNNIEKIKLKEFSKKIAIVHQYNTCPNDVTVRTLVSYGRIPYEKYYSKNYEEDEKLINWALEVTNLTEYKDRKMSDLSGGQKQRVWIAMALAQNTKILFLDEPTTYLDVRYQIEILKLIKKLNREYKITIIMVLHHINQAIYYSDEIIALKNGELLAQGHPDKVIDKELIKDMYNIELEIYSIDNKKFVLEV